MAEQSLPTFEITRSQHRVEEVSKPLVSPQLHQPSTMTCHKDRVAMWFLGSSPSDVWTKTETALTAAALPNRECQT